MLTPTEVQANAICLTAHGELTRERKLKDTAPTQSPPLSTLPFTHTGYPEDPDRDSRVPRTLIRTLESLDALEY